MVVSAPTGSGKTVVFELAVLRAMTRFITEEGVLCPPSGRAKAVSTELCSVPPELLVLPSSAVCDGDAKLKLY